MIDQETPDVCITLVHGTWGRGFFPDRRFSKGAKRKQLWFDDGSLFTTRLKFKLKELGISYKIQAHKWSGANSILERAKVAKQLAAQLQASRAEYPAAKQVVIAHSHGGNVVRLALKEVQDRRHILVVTMATPFAEINVIPVSNTEKNIILGIWGAWGAAGTHIDTVNLSTLGLSVKSITIVILSSVVIACLALFSISRLIIHHSTMEKVLEATEGGMKWWDLEVPLLVIRAVDDEASLSLAAGAIGNRLSMGLARVIARILHAMRGKKALVGTVILSVVLLLTYHFDYFGIVAVRWFFENAPANWWLMLLYSFGLIVLICVLISGMFKSVYGRELLLGCFLCEVNSHSAPDQGSWVIVRTISEHSEAEEGLRHSLYDHKHCVQHIVWWIQLAALGRSAGFSALDDVGAVADDSKPISTARR